MMKALEDKVESASKIAGIIERIGLPIGLCIFCVGFGTYVMYWNMTVSREDKKEHRAEMAVMANQYKEQADRMASVVEANTKAQIESSSNMTNALKSLEMEMKRN